ncbi:hypothetical protein QYE76_001975 [Lolium multiflorum]|uniref:Uncharacterized protein n=1 Tax=Lolium multiflorum TaxID=4521 RepID=A0AAD8VXG1_LOLMU|nr:hypothetical protein QYE76_001975 [Lolium multiflorum]
MSRNCLVNFENPSRLYVKCIKMHVDMKLLHSVLQLRYTPSNELSEKGCSETGLLANAVQDADNQHFALVSESYVPLHNFDYVYSNRMGTNIRFVDSFSDPGSHGADRYSDNMLHDIVKRDWRKGARISMYEVAVVTLTSQRTSLPNTLCHTAPALRFIAQAENKLAEKDRCPILIVGKVHAKKYVINNTTS